MLTAKTTSKQLIIAPEGIESELREMGRDKFLICPACEGSVYFRSGSFTPHFVHYSAECTVRFSEPETKEHLAVKWALYSALKKQGLPAELEHYVPETGQRADVWAVSRGQSTAFEVQMSSIPNHIWRERQELYESEDIKSVWYLGFNPKWAGENLFPLDGEGDWESTHYRFWGDYFLQVYAEVSIITTDQGVKWHIDTRLITNAPGMRSSGNIAHATIPMDAFRIFRGCPDTEDGKLSQLVRRFLSDFHLRLPHVSLPEADMPDWWQRLYITEPFHAFPPAHRFPLPHSDGYVPPCGPYKPILKPQ